MGPQAAVLPERRRRQGRWLFVAAVLAMLTIPGQSQSSIDVVRHDSTREPQPIRIGILHSLTGPMAMSESSVKDAALLAVDEINAAGGLLGRRVVPVVADGASDWVTFAHEAQRLLSVHRVTTVFGGWTSASRKAMVPVFERNRALLWYPVQYEGFETSPHVVYTGATTNQQTVPALDWLRAEGRRRIYLVGSDYVFPRTAHQVVRRYAAAHGMEVVGERFAELSEGEFAPVIREIRATRPDVVVNTLNGAGNVAFFRQLSAAGVDPSDVTVLSLSVAENEIAIIGPQHVAGHLVAWPYFQSIDTPENRRFVAAYRNRYGPHRVTDDPIEAGYTQVHLWAAAVRRAGTSEPDSVRRALPGLSVTGPGGVVTVDPSNQHVWKPVRIGRVRRDGQVSEVRQAGQPIAPDPYLESSKWWP